MLSNKKGSYFSCFNRPLSKYHGLFLFDSDLMSMHKFIESIEIEDENDPDEIINNVYFFERTRKGLSESFVFPSGKNSLLYELDAPRKLNLCLDCREVYDERVWGRNYDITLQDGVVLIHFTKFTDKREDSTEGIEEYSLYLAVKSDYGTYGQIDEWIKRDYDQDRQRNSRSERFVYKALSAHGTRFVFSMSKNRETAINECKNSFLNFERLKKDEEHYTERMLDYFGANDLLLKNNIPDDAKLAYVNAINSLNNLLVHDEFSPGLIAGFPWFFQYWSRDSLVSINQVARISHSMGAKMLSDYLNSIDGDGRIPNLIGSFGNFNKSCDAHGWLFARCHQMIHRTREHRDIVNSINRIISSIKKSNPDDFAIKKISDAEMISEREFYNSHRLEISIESSLEKSFFRLNKSKTMEMLEYNSAGETWMDSSYENDNRAGFRIEIQAFRLNMHRLMFELTQDSKHKSLENMALAKVLQNFWNGNELADGMGDFTARPNVFIAAYVYRHLLSNEDWEKCLDSLIPKLWLDWGGLSTIDKSHNLFTDSDTGENAKSYHRGNSWFWINNTAAIVLQKLNKEKYSDKIKKIVSASTEDILWKGCIGCSSEMSDAKDLVSRGCSSQAWSNSMFIEMIEEVLLK